MRVTSDTLRSAFLSALEQAQRRIAETQNQVTTGKRINTPSDDPVAAARVAALDASLTRLDQFRVNTQLARNQLRQITLDLVGDLEAAIGLGGLLRHGGWCACC